MDVKVNMSFDIFCLSWTTTLRYCKRYSESLPS